MAEFRQRKAPRASVRFRTLTHGVVCAPQIGACTEAHQSCTWYTIGSERRDHAHERSAVPGEVMDVDQIRFCLARKSASSRSNLRSRIAFRAMGLRWSKLLTTSLTRTPLSK